MDCRHIQFRYVDALETGELDQLVALFRAAAFWAQDRTADGMATAIAHSTPVVTAWDGDRLMGFARATTDGIYRATLWDVVIHPSYQGGGLGRRLVETVLAHPQVAHVERVYLMTTHQHGFYERIGFTANPSSTLVLLHNDAVAPLPPLSPMTIEMGVSAGEQS